MDKKELLAGLSERLGIELVPDESGNCSIVFEDRYSITLRYDEQRDAFLLLGVVADDLPEDLSRAAALEIMELALGCALEGVPGIGRDSESGLIVASLTMYAANTTVDELAEAFSKFVEFQVLMTERFLQLEAGEPLPSENEEPEPLPLQGLSV